MRIDDEPTDPAARLAMARSVCRTVARKTGRNFYYAFRVLPGDKHADMCTLYAFMRKTDDLADSQAPAGERRRLLEEWRVDLDAALKRGTSPNLFLSATAEMVARRGVEAEHLHAVIDGCVQDTRPVAVATRTDLDRYCYQVAGAVGLCCVEVWGFDPSRADEVRRLSVATGEAFQLTNILRDVREDAENGRVYLPAESIGELTAADFTAVRGRPQGAVRAVIEAHVRAAEEAYAESAGLLPLLSRDGRRVLTAMRSIYGGLLREIVVRDYDVFTRRVRLPAWRKLAAAARAGWVR